MTRLILPAAVACVIFLAVGSTHGETRTDAAERYVDSAVVFVVDVSYSMSDYELHVARESHASAIASYEVLEAVAGGALGRSAFAYVEFGTRAQTLIDWRVVDSPASAVAFAGQIRQAGDERLGGLTAIGEGLYEAVRLFRRLPYTPTRKVVDVTGDGVRNAGRDLADPRARLLERGVVINGLPMTFNTDEEDLTGYYAREVIGGAGAFSLTLERIEDMPMLMRQKIVMELF